MSKTFSIVKTIDIDKILDEIVNHSINTGEENPYLFMNKDTVAAIGREIEMPYVNNIKLDGIVAKYHGYKVYLNNDLTFGEVEIR